MAVRSTRAPGLVVTDLTRQPVGPDGRAVVYTAVDVETTGLSDQDRIVELAAVVFRGDGEILDEYATVVDPVTVSTSATSGIHGLTDAHVAGAPRADTVLAELWRLSAGTVLVAHNLAFEQRFLTHESLRARMAVPEMLSLCTLRTGRAQLDGRTFKLGPLYKTATGQWPDDGHTALGDARATADILCWMLRQAPGGLYFRHWPPQAPDPRYARVVPGKVAPRPTPARSNELADFVKRFPRSRTPRPATPDAEEHYLALLGEVVADERITVDEAAALESCARAGGLTQVQLENLHHRAFFLVLGDEVNIPPADLTPVRRRELLSLATALGARPVIDALSPLVKADKAEARKPASTGYLRGWRIGLDPASGYQLDHLRDLAQQHDASVAKRLTKTVRFLATTVADSPDQAKARELGLMVIGLSEAVRLMDEAVRAADLAEFERRQEQARWEAERAERDQFWRHTWKRVEDLAAADQSFQGVAP
jgi:DNA polymerase-3 subunit epsilon